MLRNKKVFYEFAFKNGFNVPKTFFVSNKEDINIVGDRISYPCLIKPEYRDRYWDRGFQNRQNTIHRIQE